MQCPKDRDVSLNQGVLADGPKAQCCPTCGGAWIAPEHYADWQAEVTQPGAAPQVTVLPSSLDTDYTPSELDSRAALCPDCRHYLVRGRIDLRHTTFFVERCPNCQGIWCDRGEWEILQQLGLAQHIGWIFSGEWQTKVRILQQAEQERQATTDKLGPEIAQRIFELAELLETHPNGDFGVAYLMRRFES